jgi:alkaline phosphatase D
MRLLKFLTIFLTYIFLQGCYKCDDYLNRNFECNPTFKTIPIDSILTSISFGSCSSQDIAQPILNDVINLHPDLFIYLGDNVYADTKDCSTFFDDYSKLACKSEFKNLVETIPTIATWDDHDYGKNDGGEEYPLKEQSKYVFLKFWNEPANSNRYQHKGIYHSIYFGDDAHKVQVILLDTRTFRSCLKGPNSAYKADYSSNKTFLGEEQWNWLEQELLKPAKIRVIASSTQFATEHNGWETWANFPLEQLKMANLIYRTKANGVIFLSGDVHYSELSKHKFYKCYPIYDCTASGITELENAPRANRFRIGKAVTKINHGNLRIDWNSNPVRITYSIFSLLGQKEFEHTISLDEIKF